MAKREAKYDNRDPEEYTGGNRKYRSTIAIDAASGRVTVPGAPGQDSRFIGEIHENTFVTERNRDKHLMRRWNAYGINAEIIDKEIVENIVVVEVPEKKAFAVSAKDVKAFGRYHQEEGFEPQYFIGVEHLKEI